MIYFISISIFLILYSFIAWRYFHYAFYFLLFYIPFQVALNPPIAGIDIATGRLMILILFGILLLKDFSNRDKKIVPLFKNDFIGILLLCILFWSGISIFWSENLFWGLRKWLVFASIFPLYWIVLYAIMRNKKLLLSVINLSGFFVALTAIIQFSSQFIWGNDPVFHFWGRNFFPIFLGQRFGETVFQYQSWFVGVSGSTIMRAVGFFPDPHTLGFYIGLILPLILVRSFYINKYSLFLCITALFLFISTFLTFGRSAYLGLLVSLMIFFVLGYRLFDIKKKAFVLFLILITILFFFVPRSPVSERFTSSFDAQESSNAERLSNWEEAVHLIKKYPIHGTGIGSYSLNVNALRGGDDIDYRVPLYAHNTYLDITAEMGIIGLLLWLSIFGYIFYKGISTILNSDSYDVKDKYLLLGVLSALSWFLVQILFDTPIWSPRVLPILMVILAIINYVGFPKSHIRQ